MLKRLVRSHFLRPRSTFQLLVLCLSSFCSTRCLPPHIRGTQNPLWLSPAAGSCPWSTQCLSQSCWGTQTFLSVWLPSLNDLPPYCFLFPSHHSYRCRAAGAINCQLFQKRHLSTRLRDNHLPQPLDLSASFDFGLRDGITLRSLFSIF